MTTESLMEQITLAGGRRLDESFFFWRDCGLELKVIKACTECGQEEAECTLSDCTFACCGEEMKVKESQ